MTKLNKKKINYQIELFKDKGPNWKKNKIMNQIEPFKDKWSNWKKN